MVIVLCRSFWFPIFSVREQDTRSGAAATYRAGERARIRLWFLVEHGAGEPADVWPLSPRGMFLRVHHVKFLARFPTVAVLLCPCTTNACLETRLFSFAFGCGTLFWAECTCLAVVCRVLVVS